VFGPGQPITLNEGEASGRPYRLEAVGPPEIRFCFWLVHPGWIHSMAAGQK
jgi:hypothetical protein